ncbi:DNA ligase D [Granulicella paludicola]|uniref:DNA ligase D n=1 Tax=Granulicella paludicola TaxID=474951 RepID=UPI0037BF4E80
MKTKAAKKSASPSAEIDRQLALYQSMRDFSITAEPSGKETPFTAKGKLPFVIQKHAASHLHYDFRLGWNGVLKSWACAKGPSYFPGDRRLAVQVEDHPIGYGGFEGIIPQGQYGGGTVMLWDQGTWEPQPGHTDVDAGLRDGSLKFTLRGTKLNGNWTLVRMGGKAANEKKPNWLLVKEHDGLEHSETDIPIIDSQPNSVVTGRSLEQIAAQQDHTWNSNDPRAKQQKEPPGLVAKPAARAAKSAPKPSPTEVPKSPKEKLPAFIPPQLASQATTPPDTGAWLHELKLDGYRIQARKSGDKVELLTRTGLDWTHRMKALAADVAKLPAHDCLLDGEVVVLADNGTTSFADLQAAFQSGGKAQLTYFVFDLLHLDDHNLRDLPLLERKKTLQQLLANAPAEIRLSEHLDTDGAAMFQKACELHAEGIISKRADSRYISGRSSSWLKLKCIREQEFVIGGFTLPAKGHAGIHGIGALLLGYYDDAGHLIYAGRTGTGFTQKLHNSLRTQLEKLKQTTTPFTDPPAEARRGAAWVKPTLVAQVRFATWTSDNLLRQASFQGLREDKPAKEVGREEPVAKTPTKTHQQSSSKGRPSKDGALEGAALKGTGFSPYIKVPKKTGASAPEGTDLRTPKRLNPNASKTFATHKEAKVTAKPTTQHAPIRLTHPDKIIDPESGTTKQQLADYYWAIAPYMLQQIEGRPLSIVRCPEGSIKPCFFQKHTNTTLPPGVESIDVPDKKTGKPEAYITVRTPEALAGLAQIGVLEVHPWGSQNDDLEHPDRIIIDLDPDAAISWPTLAAAAAEVRARLKKLGLESFLKSTGGKGLHIVVPIAPDHDWPTVKAFAHNFVLQLEKDNPRLYLTKMSKAARKDHIYLDYLRNERGATAVAAFSPRARAGMPVSLPLPWSDLKLPERPLFYLSNFADWKSRLRSNPWKQLPTLHDQTIPTPQG